MKNEINLNIEFSKKLTEDEQSDFWCSLVNEIENMNLIAGGGHDEEKFTWVIDYSDSSMAKGEIIDRLGDFLMEKDEIILKL